MLIQYDIYDILNSYSSSDLIYSSLEFMPGTSLGRSGLKDHGASGTCGTPSSFSVFRCDQWEHQDPEVEILYLYYVYVYIYIYIYYDDICI